MIEIFAVQPKFVTIVAHDRVIRVPAIIENKWCTNLSLFIVITIVLFQKLFYFTIRYRLDLLYIGIVVFDPLVNWVNIIFVEHIKLVHLFLSLIDIILTYKKFLTFPSTFLGRSINFKTGCVWCTFSERFIYNLIYYTNCIIITATDVPLCNINDRL